MLSHTNQYAGCNKLQLEHITLRPLELNDDLAIYALRSHPDIFKYVDIKPYEDVPRAQRFIRAVLKDIDEEEAYFWGIALKDSDYIIGTVCIWNFNDDYSKAELGYELHPDYHGKGYMRETVDAILKYMCTQTNIQVIEAITHRDNMPSLKLLDYFSFKNLGVADDVRGDLEEGPDMLLYEWVVKRT